MPTRWSVFKVLAGLGASLLVWSLPVTTSAAADSWVEVSSPNFRVVSNNGERSARDTAWQFEQIRAGIAQGWPWAQAPLDRPLVIVGVKNEATLKLFAPAYFEPGKTVKYSSISASSWDRHYIVMRADLTVDGGEGVNPYRTAYWTYCDLMLSSAFHAKLPVWLSRGMAAVLSNTNVSDKEIQFGRAVPSYVEELRRGGRHSLEQVFAMTRQSPEFQREVERQRFDAQAWGLVHFLLFGDASSENRESRINALAAALTSGLPSAEAVEKIYGPLAELDTAYRRYVDRGLFRFMSVKTELNISEKEFSAQPFAAIDVTAVRAGYHVASNRPIEARAAIAEVRTGAPDRPASFEIEGLLLEREGRFEEARAAYEKAVAMNSTNFFPYGRVASMLQRTPGPDTAANRKTLLEKSIALNNNYAQSQAALASLLMQQRQFDVALAPARRSVELDQSQVFGHTTLASALAYAGKKDDALAETKIAMALARTDVERQAVQSTINQIERIK